MKFKLGVLQPQGATAAVRQAIVLYFIRHAAHQGVLLLELFCPSPYRLLHLPSSAPLQPSGPPVQWDHDAQQLRGGAQPGRDERPQRAERGGPECGALLQHLGGHVQPGEESRQRRPGLHVAGWQQEAALQSGRKDGGHRGAVAVEQEHTAAQPAGSVYNILLLLLNVNSLDEASLLVQVKFHFPLHPSLFLSITVEHHFVIFHHF